jgi:hypothetical protein
MEDRVTLRRTFARSGELFAAGAGQSAAILAVALVPASVLVAASYLATGLTTQARVNEAIQNGEWFRPLPVVAAGLARTLAGTLAYVALVFAADARRAGAPLTLRDAYGFAVERFAAFLLTALRALAWICGGLVLFVVPGVVLAFRYSLAHLAVILESERGAAALDRSSELVLSQPLRALGFMAAAAGVALVLDFWLAVAGALGTGLLEGVTGRRIGAVAGQLQALLAELASGMLAAWLIGFAVLLYRDLASRLPPKP